jgi:hypothetical protein
VPRGSSGTPRSRATSPKNGCAAAPEARGTNSGQPELAVALPAMLPALLQPVHQPGSRPLASPSVPGATLLLARAPALGWDAPVGDAGDAPVAGHRPHAAARRPGDSGLYRQPRGTTCAASPFRRWSRAGRVCPWPGRSVRRQRTRSFRTRPPVAIMRGQRSRRYMRRLRTAESATCQRRPVISEWCVHRRPVLQRPFGREALGGSMRAGPARCGRVHRCGRAGRGQGGARLA